MSEIVNAKVTECDIIEERGMLCFGILFEGPSWGQGTGYYRVDSPPNDTNPGVSKMIRAALVACGVNRLRDCKGRVVRIKRERGEIVEFGHLMEEKWFSLAKIAEESRNEQ